MEPTCALLYNQAMRRERCLRDRLDPLAQNDEGLLRQYRLPKQELLRVVEKVKPYLRVRRSDAVPIHTPDLMVLRKLESGCTQKAIAEYFGKLVGSWVTPFSLGYFFSFGSGFFFLFH